jgi:hypothetical protein
MLDRGGQASRGTDGVTVKRRFTGVYRQPKMSADADATSTSHAQAVIANACVRR